MSKVSAAADVLLMLICTLHTVQVRTVAKAAAILFKCQTGIAARSGRKISLRGRERVRGAILN